MVDAAHAHLDCDATLKGVIGGGHAAGAAGAARVIFVTSADANDVQ
jgi:hypothetical protein